jgi:release factor glutamine methyltransferase
VNGSSVDAVLAAAGQAGIARHDAQRLLAAVLQKPRTWLMAHGEVALTAVQSDHWQGLLQRARSGEPLAYLLGDHEFFGLRLKVGPAVLVPRADTETLVEWALDCLRTAAESSPAPLRVLDLGTGSGAVALAVKHQHPPADVWATDASADALAVAQENGRTWGLDVHWRLGDWWSAVAEDRFDLVLSNPPYIAEGDPHLAALAHEPPQALASGADGLDALRLIIAGAGRHLNPGGWLLLEHGHAQASAVGTLLAGADFHAVQSRPDLAGHLRCTGGQLLR